MINYSFVLSHVLTVLNVFFSNTKSIYLSIYPLQHACFKHNDKALTFTVSKLQSHKSIPLVESKDIGSSTVGIQYDSGCQLCSYSNLLSETTGKSTQVKLVQYATEVRLKLNSFTLQLYGIEHDLNSASAFSTVIPNQWRACTGKQTIVPLF